MCVPPFRRYLKFQLDRSNRREFRQDAKEIEATVSRFSSTINFHKNRRIAPNTFTLNVT